MVAAVYIPPAQSGYTSSRYVGTWDSLLEAASTVQLAYDIPASHLVLLGDFNAHISGEKAGIIPEYLVSRCRAPSYAGYRVLVSRHSECSASVDARGASLLR